MTTQTRKTEVFLAEEEYDALVKIAEREGQSVPDLIGEIVREEIPKRSLGMGLTGEEISERLAVLERIKEHREAILARRGGKPIEFDVVEEINKMREERDQDILRGIINDSD